TPLSRRAGGWRSPGSSGGGRRRGRRRAVRSQGSRLSGYRSGGGLPPAMAGTIETSAPSASGVWRPERKRISFSFTKMLTNWRSSPRSSMIFARKPGNRRSRSSSACARLPPLTTITRSPFVIRRRGVGIRTGTAIDRSPQCAAIAREGQHPLFERRQGWLDGHHTLDDLLHRLERLQPDAGDVGDGDL